MEVGELVGVGRHSIGHGHARERGHVVRVRVLLLKIHGHRSS